MTQTRPIAATASASLMVHSVPLSVVISCVGRRHHLAQTLPMLAAQPAPDFARPPGWPLRRTMQYVFEPLSNRLST